MASSRFIQQDIGSKTTRRAGRVTAAIVCVVCGALVVGAVLAVRYANNTGSIARNVSVPDGGRSAENTTQPSVDPPLSPPNIDDSATESPQGSTASEIDRAKENRSVAAKKDAAAEGDKTPPAKPIPAKTTQTKPADENSGDYLTDLQPMELVGLAAPADEAFRVIEIDDRRYERGIWMQPDKPSGTSQVSYMLPEGYATLTGVAGIAKLPKVQGDMETTVIFRIYGDGNLLWESDPLRGAGARQEIAAEIAGVKLLALTCEADGALPSASGAFGNLRLGSE